MVADAALSQDADSARNQKSSAPAPRPKMRASHWLTLHSRLAARKGMQALLSSIDSPLLAITGSIVVAVTAVARIQPAIVASCLAF